ncbi:uroporphyrinogen-III synthase [Anaplasma bovis]|uniref:uroporphyrinogen-III synthase n=1 Tax=Anaplasma bovis TaxID=186733 RepID=UPI002FEE767D
MLVVTRAMGDSIRTRDKLIELGFDVFIEPMFEVEYLDFGTVSLDKYDVIAITSRYGIDALSSLTDVRSISIVTVGDATKAYAESLGFRDVTSVAGVATDLSNHISLYAKNAKVLYARGVDIAHDLASTVRNAGVEVEELIVYRTMASSALSTEFCELLVTGKISGIVFYSKGAARTFVDLATKYNDCFYMTCAYTLGSDYIETLGKYPWKGIYASKFPSEEALFQLLVDKRSL